jgi:hypothetical protein
MSKYSAPTNTPRQRGWGIKTFIMVKFGGVPKSQESMFSKAAKKLGAP